MEWIEQYGAAGAFVLVVVRMFLDSRGKSAASDLVDELERNKVTAERLARLMRGLENRLEVLPEVVVTERMRQVNEISAIVRDTMRAVEKLTAAVDRLVERMAK